jgi:hypothetical protein
MRETLTTLLVAHWMLIGASVLILLVLLSARTRTALAAVARYLARPLLLIAVIALVYDGTRTIAGGGGLVTTSLLEHWQNLAPVSLANAKAVVAARVHPFAWDGLIMRILVLPAWLVTGALGLVFSYLGRKRSKINVFAN